MKLSRTSLVLGLSLLFCGNAQWILAQNTTITGSLTVSSSTTISGELNVTGVADFNNNVTNFGTTTTATTSPGLVLTYTDSGTVSTITFDAAGTTNIWQWERNGAGGFLRQMTLSDASNSNILTIYTPTATPSAGIILNPGGISTFSDRIIITGTSSVTATDTTSVLTVGAANNIYLKSSDAVTTYVPLSASTVTIGYQNTGDGAGSFTIGTQNTVNGVNAVAVGKGNHASGTSSFAIGNGHTITGDYATGIGHSNIASNYSSMAIGEANIASGWCALALGHVTTASGMESTAMGAYTTASGNYATAMGLRTIAQGRNQVVLGQFNVVQGDSVNWVTTDDLLIIGNGSADNARSNALTVKKNGDITATGSLMLSGMNSNASIGGSATISGKLKVSGVTTFSERIYAANAIHVNPSGDLSMGEFTSGDLTQAEMIASTYASTLAAVSASLSATERMHVEEFLSGLDDIVGLDNVVECWSLRSTQNAGTGTMVYGMCNHYNGTMTGSLTWSDIGIIWPASGTNYIGVGYTIPATPSNPDLTMVVVARSNNDISITKYYLRFMTSNGAYGLGVDSDYNAFYPDCDVRPNGGATEFYQLTNTRMLAFSKTGNTVTGYKSGNLVVTGTTSVSQAGATNLRIGGELKGYTVMFAAVLKVGLTAEKHAGLYNLYKSTIGQGLSLP